MRYQPLLCSVLLMCVAMSAGCRALGFGYGPDESVRDEYMQMVYPGDAPVADDVDIYTRRNGDALRLTNRSAHTFSNAQLWLNQQYVTVVPELPIGETTVVPLDRCINRHGEAYPYGGLFNPDKNYPIVLVELYTPGEANDDTVQGKRYRLLATSTRQTP